MRRLHKHHMNLQSVDQLIIKHVCPSVCVCVYAYVHVHVCPCVYVSCVCACMYIYVCGNLYGCRMKVSGGGIQACFTIRELSRCWLEQRWLSANDDNEKYGNLKGEEVKSSKEVVIGWTTVMNGKQENS